jgi:hypothetical protein
MDRCSVVRDARQAFGCRHGDGRQEPCDHGARPLSRRFDLRPEALALLFALTSVDTANWLIVAIAPILLRTALQLAVMLHEWAHAAAAGGAVQIAESGSAWQALTRGLLPFQPIYLPGLDDPRLAPFVAIEPLSRARRRLAALAGPGANLGLLLIFAAVLSWGSVAGGPAQILLVLLILSNSYILATS